MFDLETPSSGVFFKQSRLDPSQHCFCAGSGRCSMWSMDGYAGKKRNPPAPGAGLWCVAQTG